MYYLSIKTTKQNKSFTKTLDSYDVLSNDVFDEREFVTEIYGTLLAYSLKRVYKAFLTLSPYHELIFYMQTPKIQTSDKDLKHC